MRNYFRYKDSHRTVNGVKQKRCTICEKWKTESDFNTDRARKDGLRSRCKDCNSEYERKLKRNRRKGDAREYLRFEQRHRTVRGVKQKLCSRCKEWKDESHFPRNSRLRDGLCSYCKECARKRYERMKKPGGRRYLKYEDRHRVVDGVKQKFCRKCKRWKDETAFYKNRSAKDGLKDWCKKCSYTPTGKSRKK
ncbi:MAG: hypothetical protein ISS70_03080 [Phycisphaerae bacterium]|nr:hypothetical protein [Phycisphaerae bacterium]